MSEDAAIFSVAATVALATTVRFTRSALRSGHPDALVCPLEAWSRAGASAMCLAGSLFAIPPVADGFEAATGVANSARLVSHLAGIALCLGLQLLLASWTYTRSALREVALVKVHVAAGAALLATALFLATNNADVEFTSNYADTRGVVAYLLVIYTYGLWAGARIAWECAGLAWTHVREGYRLDAVGQALIAAGGLACVTYTGAEASFLIAYQYQRAWKTCTEFALSSFCAGLFMVLSFAGLAVASLARRRDRRQSEATTAA